MPTVLVTLGRLPKGLDLIRSFRALGWRVVVADPYRNHLARVSRAVAKTYHLPAPHSAPQAYCHALLEIITQEKVDLVLPVSEDILYVSLLNDVLPSHVRLLSMPHEEIAALHDKYEFIQRARKIGLPVPETARLSEPYAAVIASRDDYVVKPRHSCAGYGVSFHVWNSQRPNRLGAILQRAIRGQEFSTCAFAHHGHVLGQAIYRSTLQSGTVAVGFERVEHDAIEEWVTRFVSATGWSGFISFDFIVDHTGTPFAIECNPRTTSGLHFFETGHLAKAILNPTQSVPLRRQKRLMQFWSVMQHWQDHLGHFKEMRRALAHLVFVRDVTWSWKDPLPLLLMPWTAQEIMQAAKRDKVPFGIAATRDFHFPPDADIE